MTGFLILLMASCLMTFDLASIKSEPNPEKRSDLALDNAGTLFDTAKEAYSAGDVAKTKASLEEVRDSVNLALESLEGTGKDGRRNPKFFKRAELKTRELLRRLDGLSQSVSVEDREFVESVRARVAEVHDDLIKDVMGKKK